MAHLLPPCLAQSGRRLLRLSDSAACPFRPSPAPLVRFGHRLPLADRWAHPVSEPGVVTFIGQCLSSPTSPPLPGHRAPPSSTPRVPLDRYHLAFIFPPLNPLLNPSLSSMALKPLTSVLNSPATPPRRSPGPYKRRAPPSSFTAPLPASFPLSPRQSSPLTEHRLCRAFTAVAYPPRCRPSPGEALAELPVRSSLCCAPVGELWRTGAAGGRAPVSAPPHPDPPPLSAPPSVHGGPSVPGRSTEAWTRSTALSVEK
jgi:hypothetical protein